MGFPGGSDGKESSCNAADPGLIPGWGQSPEKDMATHSSILAWRTPWTEGRETALCDTIVVDTGYYKFVEIHTTPRARQSIEKNDDRKY